MIGTPARVKRSAHSGRQAVHKGHAGLEGLLGVVAGGLLGAHRQVADEHVGAGGGQGDGHVDRGGVGLVDGLGVVVAQPVEGRRALHLDPERGHVGELDGVVLAGADGLGEVAPDLLGVDVEGGHELDVADVVAAELDVHQTGDVVTRLGVGVEVDALHQRRRAVAHADNRDA
jgi:hypothetical protein